MKKLFIVCGALESGGAERVISILSKPLSEEYETVLITWRNSDAFYKIDPKIQVISLPIFTKSNNIIKKIIKFRKLSKKVKPDLILSFLTPFNILTIISLWFTNFKIVAAERLDPRYLKGGKLMQWIRNQIYKRADFILCQTNFIKDLYPNYLQKKIYILYNPIILEKSLIGKALTFEKGNTIVAVGRLHPQKNYNLMIDGFNLFLEDFPDYKLLIYGIGSLQDSLEKKIEELNLQNHVILKGNSKTIHQDILSAKVFLMTSLFEGMSNALIEAMCLGIPVISTKVSGATDLIKDKENGILIEDKPEDIKNALELILKSEDRAKEMGNKACEVYNKLNVEIISKEWIDFINYAIHH
ncbi:MAG: glycosyltransferase [Muribaculaceae bacterium]|nr:glycosyltransferase [Muribaculaceae bacterium]